MSEADGTVTIDGGFHGGSSVHHNFRPIKIIVYHNGDELDPGTVVMVTRREYKHWIVFLDGLTRKLHTTTAVHRVYDTHGIRIENFDELRHGGEYVAVTKMPFIPCVYGSRRMPLGSARPFHVPWNIEEPKSSFLDDAEAMDIYLKKQGYGSITGLPYPLDSIVLKSEMSMGMMEDEKLNHPTFMARQMVDEVVSEAAKQFGAAPPSRGGFQLAHLHSHMASGRRSRSPPKKTPRGGEAVKDDGFHNKDDYGGHFHSHGGGREGGRGGEEDGERRAGGGRGGGARREEEDGERRGGSAGGGRGGGGGAEGGGRGREGGDNKENKDTIASGADGETTKGSKKAGPSSSRTSGYHAVDSAIPSHAYVREEKKRQTETTIITRYEGSPRRFPCSKSNGLDVHLSSSSEEDLKKKKGGDDFKGSLSKKDLEKAIDVKIELTAPSPKEAKGEGKDSLLSKDKELESAPIDTGHEGDKAPEEEKEPPRESKRAKWDASTVVDSSPKKTATAYDSPGIDRNYLKKFAAATKDDPSFVPLDGKRTPRDVVEDSSKETVEVTSKHQEPAISARLESKPAPSTRDKPSSFKKSTAIPRIVKNTAASARAAPSERKVEIVDKTKEKRPSLLPPLPSSVTETRTTTKKKVTLEPLALPPIQKTTTVTTSTTRTKEVKREGDEAPPLSSRPSARGLSMEAEDVDLGHLSGRRVKDITGGWGGSERRIDLFADDDDIPARYAALPRTLTLPQRLNDRTLYYARRFESIHSYQRYPNDYYYYDSDIDDLDPDLFDV